MLKYIKLMRPKHYIKNLLIFLPLLFNGNFFDKSDFLLTTYGFISFCLIASIIYIINDIKDRKLDRLDENKAKRPIASGSISIKSAVAEIIILFVLLILVIYLSKLPLQASGILTIYLLINIAYSYGLKNIPLLDVFILVTCYILRIWFGAMIIDIEISNWFYLTILSISFYFALGKRRNELQKNTNKRAVLQYYNKNFLDKNMYMFLTMGIVFYSLWAMENSNQFLIYTVPLVIIICMKYSMDVEKECDGDPINIIFQDKIILLLGIILLILLFLCLYFL